MKTVVSYLFIGLLFWGMTGPGFGSAWASQSDSQSMQGAWMSNLGGTSYYHHNGAGGTQPGGYHHPSGYGSGSGYCW